MCDDDEAAYLRGELASAEMELEALRARMLALADAWEAREVDDERHAAEHWSQAPGDLRAAVEKDD